MILIFFPTLALTNVCWTQLSRRAEWLSVGLIFTRLVQQRQMCAMLQSRRRAGETLRGWKLYRSSTFHKSTQLFCELPHGISLSVLWRQHERVDRCSDANTVVAAFHVQKVCGFKNCVYGRFNTVSTRLDVENVFSTWKCAVLHVRSHLDVCTFLHVLDKERTVVATNKSSFSGSLATTLLIV